MEEVKSVHNWVSHCIYLTLIEYCMIFDRFLIFHSSANIYNQFYLLIPFLVASYSSFSCCLMVVLLVSLFFLHVIVHGSLLGLAFIIAWQFLNLCSVWHLPLQNWLHTLSMYGIWKFPFCHFKLKEVKPDTWEVQAEFSWFQFCWFYEKGNVYMGILPLNQVDEHLPQLFRFVKHWFCISYSSGYMEQIGLSCRSQIRQTITTLSTFVPYNQN